MSRISLIAAMAENRVIGRDGKMPWHLPEDLKRFRAITTGHPVIMGRKTYESIGRLLPGRKNVIISRQPSYAVPGALVVASLEAAFAACPEDDVFVIGGGEIYRQALSRADRIHLTLIHAKFEGDAFFPELDFKSFSESAREAREADGLRYSFLTYDRTV